MEFKPHEYQRQAIDFVKNNTHCALFLEMGLGKTVITLTAISELPDIKKVLIVAPKRVAMGTWSTEAAKWEHTKGLKVSVILGNEIERLAALRAEADIYVTSRDLVSWLVSTVTRPRGCGKVFDFDMVVIDELSSFKNKDTQRFRALKEVRLCPKRIVGLTGTPAANSLMDLWAEIGIIDGGARLGRSFSAFRSTYFRPGATNGHITYNWIERKGSQEAITGKISDMCLSMKASDHLKMPELIIDDMPVILDGEAKKYYDELERDMLLSVSEDEEITVGSAAALTNKLLQLGNGNVYDENGIVHFIHSCKIDAFKELLDSLGGEHALVFYSFKSDVPPILEACEGLEARTLDTDEDAKAWNAGEVDVLLAHPASCAYGLNLQQGGHHIIYFGLPWSCELYEQANARLHRQGQTMPTIVHRLIVKGGVDEDVVTALERKSKLQDAIKEAIKRRIQ